MATNLGKSLLKNQFGEQSNNRVVVPSSGVLAGVWMVMPNGAYFMAGSGAPTSSAPAGSVYFRNDGGTADLLIYVNPTLGNNWVASHLTT